MGTNNEDEIATGSGMKALGKAVIILFLLVAFTPTRGIAAPVMVLVVAWTVFRSLSWLMSKHRRVGQLVLVALIAAVTIYGFMAYGSIQTHRAISEKLSDYRSVSVERRMFPLPSVYRLKMGRGTRDAELEEVLALPGLQGVTEVRLESRLLTDAALPLVALLPNLSYPFIDCVQMSDAAILEFESQVPECRVIAYQRNLHNTPPVFLGAPRLTP